MEYRHIELKKLFAKIAQSKKYTGSPLECDAVSIIYRQFKDNTAYKRSIRGRINAKNATTIEDIQAAIVQAAREMTKFYNKLEAK